MNILNGEFGEHLPMAELPAIVLAPLVLEEEDLSPSPLAGHTSRDLGAGQRGRIKVKTVPVFYQKHLIQRDDFAHTSVQLFDAKHLPGAHLVLLAAGTYDCVHRISLPPNKTLSYSTRVSLSRIKRFAGSSSSHWLGEVTVHGFFRNQLFGSAWQVVANPLSGSGMMLASPAGITGRSFSGQARAQISYCSRWRCWLAWTVISTWYRLSRFSRRWRSSSHRRLATAG